MLIKLSLFSVAVFKVNSNYLTLWFFKTHLYPECHPERITFIAYHSYTCPDLTAQS